MNADQNEVRQYGGGGDVRFVRRRGTASAFATRSTQPKRAAPPQPNSADENCGLVECATHAIPGRHVRSGRAGGVYRCEASSMVFQATSTRARGVNKLFFNKESREYVERCTGSREFLSPGNLHFKGRPRLLPFACDHGSCRSVIRHGMWIRLLPRDRSCATCAPWRDTANPPRRPGAPRRRRRRRNSHTAPRPGHFLPLRSVGAP